MFKYCVLSALLGAVLGLFSYCTPSFRPIGGYIGELASEEEETDTDDSGALNEDEDEEEDDDDDSNDSDSNDKKEMPYEISMDTFAFMGCNFRDDEDDSIFHLKAGAFNRDKNLGGIRIRKFAQNKTPQEIIKDYPYADSSPLLFLDISPINIFSHFVDSRGLRLKNELSDLLDSKKNFIQRFDNDYLSASLIYDTNDSAVDSAYEFARTLGTRTLIAGFNKGGESGPRKNQDNEFHGVSYELTMKKKYENFFIEDIDEEYPNSGSVAWSCLEQPYEIRRHSDNRPDDEPGCSDNRTNRATFSNLKNILGDDWAIDSANKCIAPKTSRMESCYQRRSGGRWEKGANLTVFFGRKAENCDHTNRKEQCPRYLSVCFRGG